jgi:hypothetical protein
MRFSFLCYLALIVTALWLVLGIVGSMDFADVQKVANNYCEQVELGNWPDYKNIYDTECKKPLPPANVSATIQP